MIQDLLRDNWHVFEAINRFAGQQSLLDPVMVVGAQDAIFVLPLLLLALWFALARWAPLGRLAVAPTASEQHSARGDRLQLAYDRSLGQRVALLGVLGVVFALILNVVVGHLVVEPRPFVSHPSQVHQLIAHATDNSFPSDHAAVAGAVTTALGLYLLLVLTSAFRLRAAPGRAQAVASVRVGLDVQVELRRRFLPEVLVAAVLFIVALLVLVWIGLARVYVGVHYPGDIVAGALWRFVASWAVSGPWPCAPCWIQSSRH